MIPEIVVSSMKLPWRQKVALYGIFSTGFLYVNQPLLPYPLLNIYSVVGAGLARTVWLARLSTGEHDLTWVGFEIFAWTEVEMQLAMICASAPALRAFFGKYLCDHFTKASRSRTYATGDSIPLKTTASNVSTALRPVSVGTVATTWPMLGDKDIMVTESFSITPIDVDSEEGQIALGEMKKERRVLGM